MRTFVCCFSITINRCIVYCGHRFHRYASNASTKVTKNSRTVCQNNDLSDSFKEVMYKVLFSFSFLVICSIIRLGMLFVRLRNNFLDVSFHACMYINVLLLILSFFFVDVEYFYTIFKCVVCVD